MKRQLTITGTLWDFWPMIRLFDTNYDSRYISFYKPWLKGKVDQKKIVQLHEKYSSPLLWPFKLVRRLWCVHKTIKSFKPDLVVSHHDDANFILACYATLVKKRPRTLIWVRNNPEQTYKTGLWSKFVLFGYKYLYKNADVIVVQTEANAAIVRKQFPALGKKIVIFPNVYDVKDINKLAFEPLPSQHNQFFKNKVFLNVGRFTKQKGQWQLIRVLATIASKYPSARLCIIGEGPDKEQMRKLVHDCGLDDKVLFAGHQPNPYKYMKAAFTFVLPSLWEGMPNTVVESLAVNKPVIAADCKTGPREILAPKLEPQAKIHYPYNGQYGVLIQAVDEEPCFLTPQQKLLTPAEHQLKQQMEKLLTDSGMRKRYGHGVQRAKQLDYHSMAGRLSTLEY